MARNQFSVKTFGESLHASHNSVASAFPIPSFAPRAPPLSSSYADSPTDKIHYFLTSFYFLELSRVYRTYMRETRCIETSR